MKLKRAPRADRSFAQGVIYDGVILSDFFDITELNVQPFPQMGAQTISIPGKKGLHFGESTMGVRTLSMKLSLRADTANDFGVFRKWRQFTDLLIKDEPKKLYIGDSQYINAMALSSSELERLGNRGVSTITFTAFDPYFYGDQHEIALRSGSNTVIIQGSCPVYPVITLTGCSGALNVQKTGTADRVVTNSISSTSAKIVIDMERQRTTANGSYFPVNMQVTDYFELDPGSNTVTVSSGSGTLSYQEKYL